MSQSDPHGEGGGMRWGAHDSVRRGGWDEMGRRRGGGVWGGGGEEVGGVPFNESCTHYQWSLSLGYSIDAT